MRILRFLFVAALLSTSIAFAQTPNNRTLVLLTTDMWTVPNGASVGAITVEAWGGGGGGSTESGGQGGGYIKASFVVAPNQQIRVAIGSGGAGGADKGTNGFGTTVDAGPGLIFNVSGGAGAGNGVAGGFTNPTNVNTVSKFYFRGAVARWVPSQKSSPLPSSILRTPLSRQSVATAATQAVPRPHAALAAVRPAR